MNDAYHQQLLRWAEEAGCAGRVHFLGNVSEDEKVDLLQHASVFLHTPVTAKDGGFEGFGIVYLEAAACGVPAIGTLDCGAEDAIVPGVTGLLVEQTVDSVRLALEHLLSSETVRKQLGAAARVHAQRSSWLDNADRVAELYRTALQRHGGSA